MTPADTLRRVEGVADRLEGWAAEQRAARHTAVAAAYQRAATELRRVLPRPDGGTR